MTHTDASGKSYESWKKKYIPFLRSEAFFFHLAFFFLRSSKKNAISTEERLEKRRLP